ncbi:MAG TPA: class I SAM-dependent methyltransferase [Anaerolineae bacterium]|nr:class I SAM-dependent methyltransferase [Anaerolineae bacterium]
MTYLCPTCRTPLDDARVCANGHAFEEKDGVLALLDPAFAAQLAAFCEPFERMRADRARPLLDPTVYARLPATPPGHPPHEWRLRRYDLALLRRLLRQRPQQKVLDVGAWNGWLSNGLASEGHLVTAVDYFDDEHDGLRAKKFYTSAWQAVQMDLLDLPALGERFDVIVLNRCVQFFPQPAAYVAQAKAQLAPGGLLILTGLEIYRDPRAKAARVARMLHSHRQRYGSDLFLRPTKGYLDFADKAQLEAQGVQIKPPWQLLPANLKALLWPALPRHCYGVYRDV